MKTTTTPDPALKRKLNAGPASRYGLIGTSVRAGRFRLYRHIPQSDGTFDRVPLTDYETAETIDNIVTDMIATGWC